MNAQRCKFCGTELPPPAKRGGTVFTPCPGCGVGARAKFCDHADGTAGYEYTWRADSANSVIVRVPSELVPEVRQIIQNWRLKSSEK